MLARASASIVHHRHATSERRGWRAYEVVRASSRTRVEDGEQLTGRGNLGRRGPFLVEPRMHADERVAHLGAAALTAVRKGGKSPSRWDTQSSETFRARGVPALLSAGVQ